MLKAAAVRAALRPLTEDDLPAVEAWYPEAAAAARGLARSQWPPAGEVRERLEAAAAEPGRRLLAVARAGEETPIGLVEFRITGDIATLFLLTLERECRGWGYGSDAALLFEEAARERGVREVRAEIDTRNGLALYFWLRLGYSPVETAEDASLSDERGGIISMIRKLG